MKPVISVGSVDITADVQFNTAKFTSQASGAPGTFDMYVRDKGHGYSPFSTGDEVTVDWDGHRLWGGYLRKVGRTFAFPAEPTPDFGRTVPRFWHLEGADYNALLNQRVIYNHVHPTWGNTSGSVSFQYPPTSFDDDVIFDLLHNYSDLEADGVTLDGIQRVGVVVYDVPGVTSGRGLKKDTWPEIAAAGYVLTQALYTIARNTGAIFYINPSKSFQYVDVDTPTSPFTLTDQPRVDGDVGYRALEILFDGTKLDNDARVWGQTLGSSATVFGRVEDAASIAEHGRWQSGLNTASLYHQASVDAVASSYVNGTPTSHRGGKDDRVAFSATVYNTPLIVAQKVRCVSAVEDFDQVYPIRKIVMTFPEPEDIRMDVALSWEPDIPWDFAEYLILHEQKIVITKIVIPTWPKPGGGGCDCITDTFNRPDQSEWGVSDTGMVWVGTVAADLTWSIASNKGNLVMDNGGLGASAFHQLALPGTTTDAVITAQLFPIAGPSSNEAVFFGADMAHDFVEVDLATDGTLTLITDTDTKTVMLPFTSSDAVRLRVETDGVGTANVKAWLAGDPEPPGWNLTGSVAHGKFVDVYTGAYVNATPAEATFDDLDVLDINPCTSGGGASGETCYPFDSFLDRVLVNDLGNVSSNGRPYNVTVSGQTNYGVGDPPGYGGFLRNNGASTAATLDAYPNNNPGDPWTVGRRFQFSVNFTQNGPLNNGAGGAPPTFKIKLEGPSCDISWVAYMSNDPLGFGTSPGLVGVDDAGNGWSAQIPKTDWLSGPPHEYIMEGYADEFVGAGVRVYPAGGVVPAWTSFTYNDGSEVGMLIPTVNLHINPNDVPSPSIFYWKNLNVCTGASGSTGGVSDNFNRPDAAVLGTSSGGAVWEVGDFSTPETGGSGQGSDGYIASNQGVFADITDATTEVAAWLATGLTYPISVEFDWIQGAPRWGFSILTSLGNLFVLIQTQSGSSGDGFFSITTLLALTGGGNYDDIWPFDIPFALPYHVVSTLNGEILTTTFYTMSGTFVASRSIDLSTFGVSSGTLGAASNLVMIGETGPPFSDGSGAPVTTIIDNLNVNGTSGGGIGCGPANPTGSTPQPDGKLCEFPATVDGHRFDTGGDFISGSLTVWVNGIVQRLNVDYTEHPSDPSGSADDQAHYFTFSTVIAPTDTVYVCYYQPSSGGGGGPKAA